MSAGGYRQSPSDLMPSPPTSPVRNPQSAVPRALQQPSSSRSSSSSADMTHGAMAGGPAGNGTGTANIRSSASSHSNGSGSSGENGQASSLNNTLQLPPGPRNPSYMGAPHGTAGLDLTSAAIARGEVGANYSRYSTSNISGLASPPMGSGARLSSISSGRTPSGTSDDIQIELDSMPTALGSYPNPSSPGISASALARSRFSEYGLADSASSDTHGFRESTLYDGDGRRQSVGYYGNTDKSMEDTSLLWNEKNVEADE